MLEIEQPNMYRGPQRAYSRHQSRLRDLDIRRTRTVSRDKPFSAIPEHDAPETSRSQTSRLFHIRRKRIRSHESGSGGLESQCSHIHSWREDAAADCAIHSRQPVRERFLEARSSQVAFPGVVETDVDEVHVGDQTRGICEVGAREGRCEIEGFGARACVQAFESAREDVVVI